MSGPSLPDAGGAPGRRSGATLDALQDLADLLSAQLDFADTVAGLFEAHHPLGVLHLLQDDRSPSGAGESEFIRGACWIGPIAAGKAAG